MPRVASTTAHIHPHPIWPSPQISSQHTCGKHFRIDGQPSRGAPGGLQAKVHTKVTVSQEPVTSQNCEEHFFERSIASSVRSRRPSERGGETNPTGTQHAHPTPPEPKTPPPRTFLLLLPQWHLAKPRVLDPDPPLPPPWAVGSRKDRREVHYVLAEWRPQLSPKG